MKGFNEEEQMKATVFYGSRRKTVEVMNRNPNEIIREFVKVTGVGRGTYVTHIKCGRYDYQWNGNCWGAYPN